MIKEIIEKIIIWIFEHYRIEEIEYSHFDRVIDITKDNIDKFRKYNDKIEVGWRINIPIMKKIRPIDYDKEKN